MVTHSQLTRRALLFPQQGTSENIDEMTLRITGYSSTISASGCLSTSRTVCIAVRLFLYGYSVFNFLMYTVFYIAMEQTHM